MINNLQIPNSHTHTYAGRERRGLAEKETRAAAVSQLHTHQKQREERLDAAIAMDVNGGNRYDVSQPLLLHLQDSIMVRLMFFFLFIMGHGFWFLKSFSFEENLWFFIDFLGLDPVCCWFSVIWNEKNHFFGNSNDSTKSIRNFDRVNQV